LIYQFFCYFSISSDSEAAPVMDMILRTLITLLYVSKEDGFVPTAV
jgi:hypothetical protein